MPWIRATALRTSKVETILSVRVQPRASKNDVAGWMGESVKIRLTTPPVEGAANAACLAFLSRILDVPVSQLTLLTGERSRTKLIRILGLSPHQVYARLGRLSP